MFIPESTPQLNGLPASSVLDANVFFGSFVEAVRNRSKAGEITPAVVVAIGGTDDKRGADRTFDFTPHDLTPYEKTIVKDLGPDPEFGGYDKFIVVIQEIKPRVAGLVRTDRTRTALFGWSLGGLCVVNTMMEHPDFFPAYLALSPSLWRSDRTIFAQIPNFKREAARLKHPLRLLIGVGSLEEQVPPNWPTSHEDFAVEAHYAKEVQNAQEMANDLTFYFAQRHWTLASKVSEGNTHNSVPWTAFNPILSFAFNPANGPVGSRQTPGADTLLESGKAPSFATLPRACIRADCTLWFSTGWRIRLTEEIVTGATV